MDGRGWHRESYRHSLAARGIGDIKVFYEEPRKFKDAKHPPDSLLENVIFYRGDDFAIAVEQGEIDHPFATWLVNKYGSNKFTGRFLGNVWWVVWDEPGMKIIMPSVDYFNEFSITALIGDKKSVMEFTRRLAGEYPENEDFQSSLKAFGSSDISDDEIMMFFPDGETESLPESEWLMDAWNEYSYESDRGLFLISEIGNWYGELKVLEPSEYRDHLYKEFRSSVDETSRTVVDGFLHTRGLEGIGQNAHNWAGFNRDVPLSDRYIQKSFNEYIEMSTKPQMKGVPWHEEFPEVYEFFRDEYIGYRKQIDDEGPGIVSVSKHNRKFRQRLNEMKQTRETVMI